MKAKTYLNIAFVLASTLTSVAAQAIDQITMTREARIQAFLRETKSAKDIYDGSIRSPKSAAFSIDGSKLYINSLEGSQTVVYDWPTLRRRKVINHLFNSKNQNLFRGETTVFNYPYYTEPSSGLNVFRGKPVEMAFSHGGKYLWISYYRRDYDAFAQSPSAVAIVDTATDDIVRVIPTGPIPKYIAISPDSRTAVITHWGDNTLGVIDISSNSVNDFRYTDLLTVERQLSQADKANTDRDRTCGFCLRGTTFSPDSRYLFVARMGGGGIAGFDMATKKYMGTALSIQPTPRHIVVSPDQKNLIVTSNVSGYITSIKITDMVSVLEKAAGRRVHGLTKREVSVGAGARTIEVDPTGQIAYAAVNDGVKVVAVDLQSMKKIGEVSLDPYPVGLAVSPDGNHVVVTSQGHSGKGGNAVNIVRVQK